MIQNALCLSSSSAEKHIQQIGLCTAAIAFLGTPHHGSDLAAWGQFGIKIVNVVKQANIEIAAVLRPESEVLANIQMGFGNLLRARQDGGTGIAITCFYEELALPLIGEVVTPPLSPRAHPD